MAGLLEPDRTQIRLSEMNAPTLGNEPKMSASSRREARGKVRGRIAKVQMAAGAGIQLLFRRVVVHVLPEPSLDFGYAHSLAFAVVGDLIAVDFAEAEISRFWMGEIEPTYA